MNKVCVVTGVGPGTGLATVKRFCAEYQVAMIARSENFLQQVDEENQNAHAFTCDMRDLEGVERTIEDVRTRLGEPDRVNPQRRAWWFRNVRADRCHVARKEFPCQRQFAAPSREAACSRHDRSRPRIDSLHWEYRRISRRTELHIVRADQGGTANPLRIISENTRTEGHTRRLRSHRRGNRSALDSPSESRSRRFLFRQTCRHR